MDQVAELSRIKTPEEFNARFWNGIILCRWIGGGPNIVVSTRLLLEFH